MFNTSTSQSVKVTTMFILVTLQVVIKSGKVSNLLRVTQGVTDVKVSNIASIPPPWYDKYHLTF